MSPTQLISRYLERHAETGALAHADRIAARLDDTPFTRVLVIPAYDEEPGFVHALLQHPAAASTLFLLVLNAPDNAPPSSRTRTLRLLQHIQGLTARNIQYIDRVTTPLPFREGVGLARKLGCDVSLHLYARQHIRSPWLFQTDADASLPAAYFLEDSFPQRGAITFSHQHVVPATVAHSAELAKAARLYEQHMAHYIQGLAAAGSAYAYPTLGSTLVVHALDYAAVRGFPRRNAGEDFYLLNKVAKVSGVTWQKSVCIELQARASLRVPFGTGPALQKILATLAEAPDGSGYLSYHPGCFVLLSSALASLAQFGANGHWQAAEILDMTESDEIQTDQTARAILKGLGWETVFPGFATQHRSPQQRTRATTDWFDAFRTLRFVHEARHYYPDQPLVHSLSRAASARATPD